MLKPCAIAAVTCAITACSYKGPSSPQAAASLEQQADATLSELRSRGPGLDTLLASSAGYVVFPSIGAAGVILAGGAGGTGVLYEFGMPVGYVSLAQASIGPQLGGQTFTELLVIRNTYDVQRLKAGSFRFGADAGIVVINAGAAVSAVATSDVTVFVEPRGGLMAGISLSGRSMQYVPRG